MKSEELLDLINKRQSVRKYLDKPVEKDKLDRCIEAVRLAPSACNAQPWKLIIIDKYENPQLHADVAKATISNVLGFNKFTKQSPVLVVIVRDSPNITSAVGSLLKDKPYTIIDSGIATAHFCLQATAEGLGTCIMGWLDEKKIQKLLSIPSSKRVELVISVGYAEKEEVRTKIRKSTDKISMYNKYQ